MPLADIDSVRPLNEAVRPVGAPGFGFGGTTLADTSGDDRLVP